MLRITRTSMALLLASAACGDDGDGEPDLLPGAPDAAIIAEPAVTGGADGDGASPVGATPATADTGPAAAPVVGAGGPAALDATAGAPSDAGTQPDARPPLVLEVPKSSMTCGSSSCDTLKNVCCESWSATNGFTGTPSCVTREKCYDMFEQVGNVNRAVPHECDGKEDCAGGLSCCLVADGAPLCELADIAQCTSKVYGPGGGGVCADASQCKLGSTRFIAPGVPLGILACNDDSDCQDVAGTKCQPEQDNTVSTGRGVKARAHVKVCR